jgi:hypothetical protein
VLRRLGYAVRALRRRQEETGANLWLGAADRGRHELIEAEVIADPRRLHGGYIGQKCFPVTGRLADSAPKRRANAMKKPGLRQMPEHLGKPGHKTRRLSRARTPERFRFRLDNVHKTLAWTAKWIEVRQPDDADTIARYRKCLMRGSHDISTPIEFS